MVKGLGWFNNIQEEARSSQTSPNTSYSSSSPLSSHEKSTFPSVYSHISGVELEKHKVDGSDRDVFVHRKGATRSFPAGHPLIPQAYREVGQPVLIPGSMGTASWVLLGSEKAMSLSFGSTAHGAGREMSRSGAKRRYRGDQVLRELESRGIYVKGDSMETVVEEVDAAYKSVDEVVEVSHQVGIGTKVARLVPIGVVKG